MEAIKTYKCPCCTAPLVFDADTQNLLCDSCGNTFPLETVQQLAEGSEAAGGVSKYNWNNYTPRTFEDTNTIKLANFSCPSCGAQISGDDTLGSTVCPYCGNPSVVKRQFDGSLMPDYIIPFKVDKKSAIEVLKNDFKNAPFLPDSFKDKNKIDEITGVYVPFWMFDCDCDASISYNAEKTTVWSDANYNYIKTDYYKLFRSGKVGFANIPVDGSAKMDNAYLEAIEPFDYEEAVDFSEAYLSGYLADKYDVSAEESIERANERVKNSTVSAFGDTTARYTAVIPENTWVDFSEGKIRYALLPVWVLNIKYQNKLYKFMVNGQTGKIAGTYPTDNKKKWKYFWKIAGIAYAAATVIAWLLLH